MTLFAKNRPFAQYVLFLIVALILLVVVGITVVDYLNAQQTSLKNQQASEEQTDFYLINAVRLTDTGLKLFDDSFNQQMEDAFIPFMEEYNRSGHDPSRMNLNTVKSRVSSQMDLYVIDADGVVEYSTYPGEEGLDFQKTSPEFYHTLEMIRASEGFFPDRVVQEYGTGILKKYAYMPTPDHRYVLEIGLASELFKETRQQIRYSDLIAEITSYNPSVENLRIFTPARRQIGDKDFVPDEALNTTLGAILQEKTGREIVDPVSGEKTRYLYINLSTDPYGSDTSRIVEVTYNNDLIRSTLRNLLVFHLAVALLALLLSSIGAVMVSRYLTRPIEGIVRDVDAIAKGDLDHTISSSPAREFRVLEESTNTMVSTLKETISRLQESEVRLTGSEERYRITSDLISDYAYSVSVDPAGVSSLVWVTGAFERILGVPREDLLAKGGLESMICPDDREVYSEHLDLLFKNQPHRSEFRVTTRSGEIRWLSHRTLPVWDAAAGRLVQYYAAGQDITKQKEVEAENRRLNEELEQRVIERTSQLEEVNRDLESFSYSVSHDLRSPLRAIDGYAYILMNTYASSLPDETQRYLQVIRQSAQRMDALINDLLNFSRIGRQALEMQLVSPSDLVRSSFDELKAEIEGRNVEITIEDLPDCRADPALLRQVFVNLLSNALKFTRNREPAEISIGSFTRDGRVTYFVRDNGVGFDMQYAGSLFGVFQQLSHRGQFEGSGVGLAIVKRIIERHGGTIRAESEVEKGATFYFTLNGGDVHV